MESDNSLLAFMDMFFSVLVSLDYATSATLLFTRPPVLKPKIQARRFYHYTMSLLIKIQLISCNTLDPEHSHDSPFLLCLSLFNFGVQCSEMLFLFRWFSLSLGSLYT